MVHFSGTLDGVLISGTDQVVVDPRLHHQGVVTLPGSVATRFVPGRRYVLCIAGHDSFVIRLVRTMLALPGVGAVYEFRSLDVPTS